jgi:hypothetical protein
MDHKGPNVWKKGIDWVADMYKATDSWVKEKRLISWALKRTGGRMVSGKTGFSGDFERTNPQPSIILKDTKQSTHMLKGVICQNLTTKTLNQVFTTLYPIPYTQYQAFKTQYQVFTTLYPKCSSTNSNLRFTKENFNRIKEIYQWIWERINTSI